jgi:hypothetical protein
MALIPVVSSSFGGLAGFGVVILVVVLACWRIDRFCARQHWDGMRDYKQ